MNARHCAKESQKWHPFVLHSKPALQNNFALKKDSTSSKPFLLLSAHCYHLIYFHKAEEKLQI
jgi:hypothetical protein